MTWHLRKAAAFAVVLLPAAQARADDDPRFCPTRPSIGGSSCTTEPGQVHAEYSFADWQRDDQPDQREDRFIAADFLTRVGLGKDTEVHRDGRRSGTIDPATRSPALSTPSTARATSR